MKLMLLGDTHGDVQRMFSVLRKAKREKVDAIVQVGDFTFFWNGDNRIDQLVNVMKQHGSIPIYFLDGNHEDHDQLAELGATHDADDFVEVAHNVFYLPRGFVWEWDGIRFMSVGGAVSVDRDPDPYAYPKPWPGRTVGIDWFENEIISYRDVDRAIANGERDGVDVLLSHDVPQLPPYLGGKMTTMGYKVDAASRSNRLALAAIAEAVDPALIVHGHYHHRYNDLWNTSVVMGLGRDGDGGGQYIIINTDQLYEEIATVRASVVRRDS